MQAAFVEQLLISAKLNRKEENKLPGSLTLQQVLHHVNGAPGDRHHGDWRCLHVTSLS